MTSLLRAAWGRMPFGSSQRGVNSSAPSIASSDAHHDTTVNENPAATQNVETNGVEGTDMQEEQVKKKDKKKKKRKSKSANSNELQAVLDPKGSREQNDEATSPGNESFKDAAHSPMRGDEDIEMNGEEEPQKKKKKGKRNSTAKKGKSTDGNLEAPAAAVSDTEMVDAPPVKSTKNRRDGSGEFTKKQTNGVQEDGFGLEPEPEEAPKPAPNTKKTRKSRKGTEKVATPEREVEQETADLPASKFSNVKRKAKTPLRKPVTSSTVNGYGNHGQQEPEAAWGNSQEYHVQASDQLISDARSATRVEEEDGTPKWPSQKALGKRKASFEVVIDSARKPKRSRKTKTPPGADLRRMGFSSSSSRGVGSISVESLSKTAEELWMQSINDNDELGRNTSRTYRPTPTFTAINHPSQQSQRSQPVENEIETDFNNAPEPEEPVGEPSPPPSRSSNKKVKRRLPVEEPILSQPEATPKPKSKKSIGKWNEPTPSQELKRSSQVAYKGKIPEEDIDAMRNAIEIYRDAHDLSQFQVIELLHEDASLAGKPSDELWKEIFEAVPDMRQRKVRDTCRRKFHNYPARGVWSAEADDELRDAYERLPGKWKDIGQLIHRMPEDCRDRWRNHLACGNSMIKYEWNEDDENSLRVAVAECIEHVEELKRIDKDGRYAGKDNESLVDWQIVSEKLGHTRSRLQCINKWKQLKEREESDIEDTLPAIYGDDWRSRKADVLTRTFTASQRLELLYAIRDSGAGKESKIPWRVVEKHLTWYDKGVRLAIKLCFRRLREKIPGHIDMKLKDILVIIIDAFESAAPNVPAELVDDTPAPKNRKSADKNSKRKSRAGVSKKATNDVLSQEDYVGGEGHITTLDRFADTAVAEGKQPDSAKHHNRQKSAISDEYVHESDDDDARNVGPTVAADQTQSGHQDEENLVVESADAGALTSKKQKKRSKKLKGPVEEPIVEEAVPEIVDEHTTTPDQVNSHDMVEPESAEASDPKKKKKRSKKPKTNVEEPPIEDAINVEPIIEEPLAVAEEAEGVEAPVLKKKKRSKKSKPAVEEPAEEPLAEELISEEPIATIEEVRSANDANSQNRKRSKKIKSSAEQPVEVEPIVEAPIIEEPPAIAPEPEINDDTFWTPVKRKNKRKAAAIDEPIAAEELEAEPALKSKRSRKSTAKKVGSPIDDNASLADGPAPSQKKKLRERMKLQGESQSQEPIAEEIVDAPELSDDLEIVMASLHKGRRKSQDGKAQKPKSNGQVSEKRMNDSDDEMEDRIKSFHENIPATETNGHLSDNDFQQNGELSDGEDPADIDATNEDHEDAYMNENEDDNEDEDDNFTAPSGLEAESGASDVDNATNDYHPSQDGLESVDLDAPIPDDSDIEESEENYSEEHPEVSEEEQLDDDEEDDEEEHTITMNGFKRTTASPDLDTEIQDADSYAEDIHNGYDRRSRSRSVSLAPSSSDESIPAVAMRRMFSVEL
ncbi:hypothetical protein B0J14DRAFT_697949 [Halenospora varia]|nr:hypothetical protein B0J14DRAFT_697949 [Halenospora varia]